MDIKQARDKAIGASVARIRTIESEQGVNVDSLKAIRSELISLAADKALFPRRHFGLNPSGESAIYRLSEDRDHRFALYGSVGAAGKSVPPHNHTTWAVIVGVHGNELNRFYRRTDDGAVEGYGSVEETGRRNVAHGTGVVFLPEDIHAISTDDGESTLHLHMYGLALDQLTERLVFNVEEGTVRKMALSTEFLSA